MGASVVSGVDAPPVLEAGEEVLDLVSLAIEDGIVAVLDFVAAMRRDAGDDAALVERFTEADRTVGAVG